MAKTAEPTILQARESFVGSLGGKVVEVFRGDLADAASPVAKRWPEKFVPLPVRFRNEARIETATAAPGEKRGA